MRTPGSGPSSRIEPASAGLARADYVFLAARTNPDAPKHKGITYFLLDMKSEGVEVKPLRELTGNAMFNTVFIDDVFVPDDLVLGEVNRGWEVSRTTLTAERVSTMKRMRADVCCARVTNSSDSFSRSSSAARAYRAPGHFR